MLQCDHFLGISTLFNEHVAPKEYRQMSMVQWGTVSSSNHCQYREETNGFLHDDFLGLDAPSVSLAQMYLNSYVPFQELVPNLV